MPDPFKMRLLPKGHAAGGVGRPWFPDCMKLYAPGPTHGRSVATLLAWEQQLCRCMHMRCECMFDHTGTPVFVRAGGAMFERVWAVARILAPRQERMGARAWESHQCAAPEQGRDGTLDGAAAAGSGGRRQGLRARLPFRREEGNRTGLRAVPAHTPQVPPLAPGCAARTGWQACQREGKIAGFSRGTLGAAAWNIGPVWGTVCMGGRNDGVGCKGRWMWD